MFLTIEFCPLILLKSYEAGLKENPANTLPILATYPT
jgi:hypothetical protein